MAGQPLRHHLRRQYDVPARTATRHRRHAHRHRRHTRTRTRPPQPTWAAIPPGPARHTRPAIPRHSRSGQYTPYNTRRRSQPPSRPPIQQPPHRPPHSPAATSHHIRPHHATSPTFRTHQRTRHPNGSRRHGTRSKTHVSPATSKCAQHRRLQRMVQSLRRNTRPPHHHSSHRQKHPRICQETTHLAGPCRLRRHPPRHPIPRHPPRPNPPPPDRYNLHRHLTPAIIAAQPPVPFHYPHDQRHPTK